MNPSGRKLRAHGLMAGFAGAMLAILGACGSGSSGGGGFAVKGTIFGYDPNTGSFDASGQQGEAPLIPINMCVVFDFTAPIRASSASSSSIVIQELDTTVTPPAPGPLAAATFTVSGSRLTICPLITFTDTNVTYGWGDIGPPPTEKTYQILFQVAPSPTVLTSTKGQQISTKDRGPFLFRTGKTVFDQKSGAPVPTMTLRDPVTGAALPTVNTPFDPAPDIEIAFDEAVIPSTVVDPGGVGSSPSIRIELDVDNNVLTTADRIVIPGTYTLTPTSSSATVLWTSLLSELPTQELPADAADGCIYVVTVVGTVTDLSGNNKINVTNDPGAEDVFTFVTLPGPSTTPVAPLLETFDTQTNNDQTSTSAKWGTVFPGFLTPGIGGGTGNDGSFDPLNVTFQTSPPSGVTVDTVNKIVTMNTNSLLAPGTQRRFDFTQFKVPATWRVRAIGPFPLAVQCSGNVTITGTVDLTGAAGAVYANGAISPGAAGAAAVGGAAGGRGGSPTDSLGVDTFFPNKVGAPVVYGKLAYGSSVATNQGLSGRSTALSTTAFTLTDANFAANLNALNVTNLWIQPNVAGDDFRFERFHTAFKVESIAAGVVTVVSDPLDPLYRGELSMETDNPWLEDDGGGGLRAPLLATQFDSYLIGELAGQPGSNLFDLDLDGAADDVANVDAGGGSDPQAVLQTFLTLGKSGAGGGGGGFTAGADGEDDPTVLDGPGAFGGTGAEGAAGGAAFPTAVLAQRVDLDTLRTATALFDDGTGAPDPSFVGHLVNPNVNQGNVFTIITVDAVDTVTILPITTSTGFVLNLNNTTMAPGNTVRVAPPYNAGGTGGGGAGLHCAGSSKNPAGHTGHPDLTDARNQNGATNTAGFYDDDGGIAPPGQVQDGLEDTNPSGEAIFTLPRWVPGGSGGAGGGSFRITAAGNIDIAAAGQVLVAGGEGGRSDLAGTTAASGGGGGSGGTVFMGAGGSLTVAAGGRISAAGGLGGAQGIGLKGGDGGAGRIRLENALGNLTAAGFVGVGIPTITAEHLGLFPGGGESIAQSIFLAIGALNPSYQQIVVNYTAKQNGVDIVANYTVNPDGTVDPGSTLATPPFDLLISAAPIDPVTGTADTANATVLADPTVTPMSTYDGLAFVRFRFVISDASTPIIIGPNSYTDVRIDSIELNADSVKP